MLNNVCGLNTIFVAGSIETFPTDHFTAAPQIVGVTPQMIQFFDDHNFQYDDSDIKQDKDEVVRYLYQIRKYKLYVLYTKIISGPIRLVSLFGITKRGQRRIRQLLKRLIHL